MAFLQPKWNAFRLAGSCVAILSNLSSGLEKIDKYLITTVETKQKHKDHMLCNHPDYSEQYNAAGFTNQD